MIIKVEMIIDTTDLCDQEYNAEPRTKNQPQILLEEIQSNLEFDGLYKVVFAEAYETNHNKPTYPG